MRRDMWLLVAMVLAVVGCGAPDAPYGTWTEKPDTATVDMTRRDIAAPHDQFTGLWCVQALGDGGRDALAPGVECVVDSADRCAAPESCTFESFDYEGRCEVYSSDGPAVTRCCQYAKTHNMVDGHIQQCRNCGSGWSCSG